VDVDDNPDLGTEYGIQSVPTLIFFCDGGVRVRITGTVSAKAILAKLQLPQTISADEPDPSQALPDHEI
jgi:thioredoxin-like negative regulator of GroEL